TMGAGIAQLGVGAGMQTLLHDPIPEALEQGTEKTRAGLRKWAERGREVDESLLVAAASLDELSACELIIEAAPERLELKRELFGIDTGYEVAKSCTELSFGEPRWKPNPIQSRLVAAGRLGRKAGRGYYDYSGESYRPDDPEPPEPGGGDGRRIVIRGDGALA